MYGYIRPDTGELRGRDYALFRAEYCGLCQTLRQRYGIPARFVVNYDLTFMAMVLSTQPPATERRRCPVHPARRRSIIRTDRALEAAADYSMILTRWKLDDTRRDENALKALAAKAGEFSFEKAYRAAAKRRPAFAENVKRCLAELDELESRNDPSLDRAADCFARILAFAAEEAPDEESKRIQRELFYHIGRSVYILDAVDDLEKDIRSDRYNPLRHRLKPGEDRLSEEEKASLRATLNLSERSAAAALMLRAPDLWQPILENIVTVGLPEITEFVFAGKWNKRNKNGGETVPPQGAEIV
ncbi:MAG: hypothetical protein IKQ10_07080 [Oscillospiraceae bacterium]|nr:hypothetical protein [Oscillospiraceae bacterium]